MSAPAAGAVQPQERISEIDIIRGFALTGIILVNISLFKAPGFAVQLSPSDYSGALDQVLAWLVEILVRGKFYTLFSFLFGLGFYIFISRLQEKQLPARSLFKRRLMILLTIGLLHLVFIWSGDILHTYALVGFFLLLFLRVPPEKLKLWVVVSLALSLAILGSLRLLEESLPYIMGQEYHATLTAFTKDAVQAYSNGSFSELTAFRAVNELPNIVFIGYFAGLPGILGFFLCGLYAGKIGLFSDIAGNLPFIKRTFKAGLVGGAVLSLIYIPLKAGMLKLHPLVQSPLAEMIHYLSTIFLSLLYLSALLLLLQNRRLARLLSPLAAMGRMALTNYLAQSLICAVVFNGYGLGLFGTLAYWEGLLFCAALLVLQIFWSNLWFKRYLFGPAEWAWRSLTYRRRLAIRNDLTS